VLLCGELSQARAATLTAVLRPARLSGAGVCPDLRDDPWHHRETSCCSLGSGRSEQAYAGAVAKLVAIGVAAEPFLAGGARSVRIAAGAFEFACFVTATLR